MSMAAGLVLELRSRGIVLWVEKGQLRYRAPAGQFTPELTSAVRECKSEIIEILRSDSSALDAGDLRVTRRDTAGLHPLGSVQEVMSEIYERSFCPQELHVVCTLQWDASLDSAVVEQSMRELMHRHTVLRSRFVSDEHGRKWVSTSDEIALTVEELTPVGTESTEQASADARDDLKELFTSFAERRFDLAIGPLLRIGVIRSADEAGTNLVVLVIHHLIVDAWSIPILRMELLTLYAAFAQGQKHALTDLPFQYTDFVAYQKEWLQSEQARPKIEYWKQRMAGAARPFWLPADRRSAIERWINPQPTGDRIESAVTSKLREWAQPEGLTMPTVVLAAFTAMLSRWSGTDDIFTFVWHLGRQHVAQFELIGCFFDAWVLRAKLAGDPCFHDVARDVQSAYREALDTLQLPGATMVEQLMYATGESSFRSIFFNYVTQAADGDSAPGKVPLGRMTGMLYNNSYLDPADHMQFSAGFVESAQGLSWTLRHDPRLFEDSTIQCVSRLLLQILEQVARDPATRISQLPALPR
jgi:pristinamycin I synthase-3/4